MKTRCCIILSNSQAWQTKKFNYSKIQITLINLIDALSCFCKISFIDVSKIFDTQPVFITSEPYKKRDHQNIFQLVQFVADLMRGIWEI
ncbi:hypothetical protein BJP43_04715 [Candidatus Williamhamiltonella defendens]|uniref:Uncharacterized protein n=1 Tax=Candidatus Williamhamiltonella defendens TaxID=138072 RepID=A0A2D3TDU2_9ENTR|nr:hypothetical protein BJP43_04715 [Candidatus Hamiltonella defensa]AYB48268.1 hypothetical protein CJJ19_00525 [Candidatus Hamiltonella defensa]